MAQVSQFPGCDRSVADVKNAITRAVLANNVVLSGLAVNVEFSCQEEFKRTMFCPFGCVAESTPQRM